MKESIDIYKITQIVVLITVVFVAILSIWWNRKTTKQAHTIELLMKNSNSDLIKDGISVLRLVNNNKSNGIKTYANTENKNLPEAISIKRLLNYYKMLSVGVNRGIYDLQIIKDSQKTIITQIYKHSESFIKQRRAINNNPTLYIEFENLVTKLNK